MVELAAVWDVARARLPHRRAAGRRAVAVGGGELARRPHRRAVERRAPAEPVHAGRDGRRLTRGEDLGDLVLVERLLLQQLEHEVVEDVAVLDEDLPGLVVRGAR